MSSPSALRKRVVLSAILLMLLPQVAVVVSFLFTSRSSRTPLSRWPDRHQRGGLTTGHVSHHTNNKYSPDCLGQHRLLLLVKSKNQKSESTAGSASSKPKRTWEENFQKLKEYKAIHGDCSVPFRYNEDTRLGTFVSRQRQRDRKGILKEEERAKLDELGFDWTGKRILRPVSWNRKLQELKEYKEEHGHCLVNVHTRTPSPLRKRVVLSAILLMLLPQVAVVVSFLLTSHSPSRTLLSRWPDRHQRGGLSTGHVSHHTKNKYSHSHFNWSASPVAVGQQQESKVRVYWNGIIKTQTKNVGGKLSKIEGVQGHSRRLQRTALHIRKTQG